MRRFELALPETLSACQQALADGPDVKLVAGKTRGEVADVLHIPEARIKVIPMECGGGFGGKIRALVELLAVLLSQAAGKPVSLIMTRREELLAGMPAPGVIIRLKTGVKRDGTPVALEGETIVEAGAYSGALLTMSAVFLSSVYLWPVFDVVGYEVLTHKPSGAAYRAPLAPQTHFAIDSQMDHIARKLGLDPTAYKLKHLQRGGDLMANNQPWAVNGAYECLQALAQHPLWQARDAWRDSGGKDGHGLRGAGLAIGGWVPNIQPTSATVRLDSDGTLAVVTGAVDIAGTNMGLALIAAEAYGVEVERVRIITGDTDSSPLAGLSAGSKTTYTMRASVRDAAADARRQTLTIAACELEVAVDDLEIDNDSVVVRGVPDRSIKLATIGKRSNTFASPIRPYSAQPQTRSSSRHRPLPPSWPASKSTRILARSRRTISWLPRMSIRPSTRSASKDRCRAARCRASVSR